MERLSLPMSELEFMFRVEVCDHCPQRTPLNGPDGQRACQQTCGQYQAVPRLYEAVRRLNPIASTSMALRGQVPVSNLGVSGALKRRRKVIQVIRKYVNR